MGEYYEMLIIMGFVLIGLGIYIYMHPDIAWKLSLERRWYLKGGEPTELYYTSQKWRAVTYIILGIIMIILSISMLTAEKRGYVVKIDGNELRIPCTYSDVEALGYRIDSDEEIETLPATSKKRKEYVVYVVKNTEGKEIKITLANQGETDQLATECELIAINVGAENGPKLVLPNGVKLGMSKSEVEAIMGRGTPRGVGASAAEYNPKVNFNTYKVNVVYDGDFMNKKVASIRVEDVIY